MKVVMIIKSLLIVAVITAMALTIAMSSSNIGSSPSSSMIKETHNSNVPTDVIPKRVSRFLAEDKVKNPRAGDHCHKDDEICYVLDGKNSTCCNNKCMDLSYDDKNCGSCKNKCKVTHTCCRGECVNLQFDKRHCGVCNNRCMPGGYCLYSMCDYA